MNKSFLINQLCWMTLTGVFIVNARKKSVLFWKMHNIAQEELNYIRILHNHADLEHPEIANFLFHHQFKMIVENNF